MAGAFAALLFLAGCSASTATPEPSAQTVENDTSAPSLSVAVAAVVNGSAETAVSATGTVSAWQEVTVGAQASGLAIAEVLVQEGDKVKKGQLLARLDDALLKAQLAQQEAAVSEAEASLEKAQAANVRAETLLKKEAVSKETAEGTRTDLKTSQARLAQARAAVDALKVQLDQAQVLAPVDGYVSRPPAVVGTVVQTGAELFRIIREGRLEVAARVPEQYLGDIEPGQEVEVTSAAGETVRAAVRGIAEEVDGATRLGIVYVGLPQESTFRPGMFARTVISTRSETVLSVPQSALVWRDGKSNVFVVGAGDVVDMRQVEVGARSDGLVAVTSGLSAGERVVTKGGGFLNDGNTVRVTADGASATSSSIEAAR